MNYTYNKNQINFAIKSEFTKKPVEFTVRRSKPPLPEELRRLELEVAYLEQWAWGQENTSSNAFLAEYAALARKNFSRILHGEMHACCLEIKKWKVATRLDEKGNNVYDTVREIRVPFRKWVRV